MKTQMMNWKIGKGISINERIAENTHDPRCCAVYVLSQQPDFLEQKEWLTECIEKHG
jgi:hypothetical protein